MKPKLSILFFIVLLFSFQNADAQLFKRLKNKAKEKAAAIENKVAEKIENKVDKTIDDALEGKEDPNASTKNEKDVGDVVIKHSVKFGSVEIKEATVVKVVKTNSGYHISGNWWSHEADIYDGFSLTIKTDQNLKHDSEEAKNSERKVFKIPEEATLKLGYDPQLPYYKKPENDFKRAVTDDYQNYDISRGEVTIDVLSDENIQISFSGNATLKKMIKKVNVMDEYTETYFEAAVSGGIDSQTPQFTNEETITKAKNDKQVTSTSNDTFQKTQTTSAIPGTYHFTHETVTKITVSEQNKTYQMSYLLNPATDYLGMKVDMGQYSEDEMDGESVIVMDKGNTHIFVESAGMKMQMSSKMMGNQSMENPTDQMGTYDYTKLTKTGNTKTILGTNCVEYTMSDSNVKINLWVAPNLNLPNWFIQNQALIKGHIMAYTIQSNQGTMTSEVIAINDNISKTINPKDYKKMF